MILTIRTDKPESEIGLFDGQNRVVYETWQAHRQLAETIHVKIRGLLQQKGANFTDITGIVVYRGPGSFTGLRIGMSVANALAYGLNVPVAAHGGEDWVQIGIAHISASSSKQPVLPDYGSLPNITVSKR